MINDRRVFAWVSILVLVISAGLIGTTLFGYGHLDLSIPAGEVVTINGHTITNTNASLKLRPGAYSISTVSARYFSTYDTVNISAFRTKTYKPAQKQRTPESIAYAVGLVSSAGPPSVSDAHWFGDTWVVESAGISTPSVLIAHYEHSQWIRVYRTGDTLDTTNIPAEVVQQAKSLEGAINATLY